MFGHGYFGAGWFGAGYWGPGASTPPPPPAVLVGMGPGWKIIFDQDTLAKWEAERRDAGGRKRLIGTLFERLYGHAVEAEPDAPAPAVAIAEVRRAKEAEFRVTRDKALRSQLQILNALQERAQEMARLKARQHARMIEDDDEEIFGMIV